MFPSTVPRHKDRTVPSIGSHCILELHGCPPARLDDKDAVLAAIRQAAAASRSTLLDAVAHRFEPQGVTALALLAESHISIHTWPELGYAACDVFTCGEEARPEQACQFLAEALGCDHYDLRRLPRGADPGRSRPLRARAAGEVA